MQVYIRVDSSIQIGSGHVMRCLTLADGLKKNGASVSFISRRYTGNLNQLILDRGFQVFPLKKLYESGFNKKDKNEYEFEDSQQSNICEIEDANDTIHAINNSKPEWLVVDNYLLSQIWEDKLRPYAKNIFVIDI